MFRKAPPGSCADLRLAARATAAGRMDFRWKFLWGFRVFGEFSRVQLLEFGLKV